MLKSFSHRHANLLMSSRTKVCIDRGILMADRQLTLEYGPELQGLSNLRVDQIK